MSSGAKRDRPTSAPIRRAKIPPVLAQGASPLPAGTGGPGGDESRSVYSRAGPASSLRPASARASLQRPGSASASGRQPVYVLDHDRTGSRPASARGTPQVRGSFGAWQGKKFAMLHTSEPNDAAVHFAGLQGTRTRLERPKSAGYQAQQGGGAGTCDLQNMLVGGRTVSRNPGQRMSAARPGGRHASVLDASSRRAMIDKIRANNLRQEELMFEGAKSAQAFVPRLRPRSATVRLSLDELYGDLDGAQNSHRAVFVSPRRAAARSRSPVRSPARSRSPVRGPDGGLRVDIRQQHFRPGHMLVDLSLPSVSEADVEYTLHPMPVRDALSVDPEVALTKLAKAGEGAKFCDDSFAPSAASLGSAQLEMEVECWSRPEAFGLRSLLPVY